MALESSSPGSVAPSPAAEPGPPARWLLWLVGLYMASGFPFGLVHNLVPVWLKTNGVSLADIGLASLLGLPWTLKVLWAPLVDRYGRAGLWIAGAMALISAALALLSATPMGPVAAALLVVVAVASATADIAIDGHFAGALPSALHGRANGVRVAAYRGAMLLVGGGAVALAGLVGWSDVFLGLAVLAAALAVLGFSLPSQPRASTSAEQWISSLLGWVLRWDTLALVAFVLLFKLGDAAMGPMVSPFWLDAGLSVGEVGLLSTGVGAAVTTAGALLGGEICTRYGLFRGLVGLGAFQAVTNLGYAAVALAPSRPLIYAASAGESLGNGLGTAAFLAFLMRACEGEQTATRFAALTALAGLTRTLAGAASGIGVERLGYPGYFAFTFALALPAFGLLPWVRLRVSA